MRNRFDTTNEGRIGVDWESDYLLEDQKSSLDQFAIVWNTDGDAVSALPVPSSSASGSYDIDIVRLPSDSNMIPALTMRRGNQLDLGSFSEQTRFLTVANDFSERTRILALDGETLALNDRQLFDWLLTAEREMLLGTDNHPIFEMPLEETACAFSRLPNGQVAMTEVARKEVESTRQKMRTVFGENTISSVNLAIETPLRCATRYFLTATPQGSAINRAGSESELSAFLIISKSGFSYGLWSPSTGLFNEYAFIAPSGDSTKLESYIKHAFDQLLLQLSPERLEQLQLSSYAQVVFASETGLQNQVKSVAEQYSKDAGIEFIPIGAPLDEVVAGGLLLGSFTFGDDTAAGAEILPPVNLARDLLVLADKEEVERRRIEEFHVLKNRKRAAFMIMAAPILVVAFLGTIIADILLQQTVFAVREVNADTRARELKPALERRKTYEANLKWYQEFITQVSQLRRQQPTGIGMLYELNKNYPFELDSSFFVSDLKLIQGGGIEITGLARNKDAVTSFLRSLEFAGGPESGSRLFSNLTYEVQEGVEQAKVTAGKKNIPAMTGSTLSGSGPAPGIIAWTIRGNYLPSVKLIPAKPAAPPGPGIPVAPTPKPNPGP